MSILKTNSITAFDAAKIAKGDLIRAKYAGWEEAVNGIVSKVTDSEIRVLHLGTISNVTNYFTIKADEVSDGKWEISWSRDLTETETEGGEDDA